MRRIFGLVFQSLIALSAFAATDGTLGATSTGTTNITITIAGIVNISNIADLNLGSWTGTGNLAANDSICIFSNNNAGIYRVTATGSGAGSAFTLASGGNTVAYDVYWNDQTGTSGSVQLTSGTQLTNQSGASNTSTTCAGGTNANFEVVIQGTVMDATPGGSYTGTLSMRIDPA